MEKVIHNIVEISIAGKNVTGDVSPMLSKITYTDKVEAESDDVTLTFEDTKAVWQSAWYPSQGDTLTVKLGNSEAMLDCGLFEIDEIELNLSPDELQVKAIAAAITQTLRTKNSKAFEKQSLRKIAQYFADKHKLKMTGNVGALQKIEVDRKTQEHQTDLSFLASLAKEYDLIFSVRGDQLVFMDTADLDKQPCILTIDRAQMSKANFKDKTAGIYESAEVSSRSVKKNSVTKSAAHYELSKGTATSGKDQLKVSGKVENASQAKAKVTGAVKANNKEKVTGAFTVPGNVKLVAGVNIDITGVGAFSGKWHITSSQHTVDTSGGYITSVEIRKIGQ
ncbi:hypothetical protein AGMMS49965_20090 [Bacteroidia bacterium]|nr:hypothetical protein AGMMS49965_20090 [Bacteroidia bacterium]